jgi:enoyl-CoA hydratase/carnithine racemase
VVADRAVLEADDLRDRRPAVGMGAEFTSQCDLRIASTNARFGWNFVHRGLVPDTGAGTWLLPRIVGLQNALRLLYTARSSTRRRPCGSATCSRS